MVSLVRRIVLIVCFLVFLSGGLFAEVKVGDTAPDFKLTTSDGKYIVSLEPYKGKRIVYLSFFATWCANCKEEMEILKELHTLYKDKGLALMAVNVKEQPEKVQKFISDFQLPFKVIMDEKAEVAKSYNLIGFPSNIIIDGEGIIRFIDSRPPVNFQELFDGMKSTLKPAGKAAPAKAKKKKV